MSFKSYLVLIGFLILSGGISKADCFSYRPYYLVNGQRACASQSEKLATLCIERTNVQQVEGLYQMFSGDFKITITSTDGEVLEAAIYHAEQNHYVDQITVDDYRPTLDNFKYENDEERPYYFFSTPDTTPNAGLLTIGERQFCYDRTGS